MGLKKDLIHILSIVIIFVYLLVFSLFFLIGCASTGGSQSKLARQKALQDSLAKVHEFNMLKFKSFGYENFKNEMYADALPHYWKVTKLDTAGRFPFVYLKLGECYFKLDKLDSEGFVYQIAIKRFPKNAHFHRTLAWLLNIKQDYEQAIEEYRRAVELDSVTWADDYRNLGKILVQQNRIAEAIPVYEKLTEIEPNNVDIFITLAQLYKSLGNEESAIRALERAVTLAPEDTNLLFRLAEASLDNPDGTVKDVVFPVVDEQTLQDLVRERKSSGSVYRRHVQTVIRGSYRSHYRRMLPSLLQALEFRSNNERHRPVMEALIVLKKHANSRIHFYPIDETVPSGWSVPIAIAIPMKTCLGILNNSVSITIRLWV